MSRKLTKEQEDKLNSELPAKRGSAKDAKKDKKQAKKQEKKAAKNDKKAKKDKKDKAEQKKEERISVQITLPKDAVNGLLKAAKIRGSNLMPAMNARIWVTK